MNQSNNTQQPNQSINLPSADVRIKICGITRQQDAEAAIACGADALGFVFYEKSKRAVTIATLDWLHTLPPFVQLTALFVNPEADWVSSVITGLPIDVLQFHGVEPEPFCRQFGKRYIKAVPMENKSAQDAMQFMAGYPSAGSFLLDNYGEQEIGGSGTQFDWSQVPDAIGKPLVIAGGLTPDNVQPVISQVKPYAVDVSSGVESSPGIKDKEKIARFVTAVKSAI
ncbi:phosphoribosylanthranilate isomerase [Ostreibacterium oceani]|uniref:N-(5'-phosphoribosyl)anthranilate isomerase n=1 Tax=Ostreibacterium oceani TaxID=2654998 RepID=A0A6N7EXQ0_9GAMM|nr:phosphoribosylanthranilate isomerase [Ostreibacterium oceani]MPV86723.1 phosphoribosylanthranilate isomerase [Ostreibacterium oceani]